MGNGEDRQIAWMPTPYCWWSSIAPSNKGTHGSISCRIGLSHRLDCRSLVFSFCLINRDGTRLFLSAKTGSLPLGWIFVVVQGPGNLGWPVRAQFWDSYKGHLTPLGAKLLTDTGEWRIVRCGSWDWRAKILSLSTVWVLLKMVSSVLGERFQFNIP